MFDKETLLKKFPFLQKFDDQKWVFENSLNREISEKEVPIHCALLMIEQLMSFIETTKFSSNWECFFSTKVRLQQIHSLLKFFTEDNQIEKSKKGTD